ncbi:hypothetical protein Zmor_015929 [Zophobas morio]|uniref:Uncharacterized protein n=1 Tax=Zophobas morio TaxID=2755281 RepID=A0AA38IKZ4_9CUCU|nr:hypothetical protein Zmor_015929 [Zophobas morio]
MVVFGKKVRKEKKKWAWRGKKIEQAKEFQYLGYTLKSNNSHRAHIQEMARKANKAIGIVWGIGKRKFGHDYKRRMMMFDSLIKSVFMYGAEIWGWREYKEERVQEKYSKLGLEKYTPEYIVRKETKREKMRVEAGKRAVGFKEKFSERGDCKILQECWKERDKYYEGKGYACEEIERMREMGRSMKEELSVRDKDIDKQEPRSRISESRYNAEYRKLVKDEVPKYTRRESIKEKRLMARFRCGNEEEENNFWMDETDRRCRICWREGETIEHMLEGCEGLRESKESREEVLNEDERGLDWMKEVWKII